MLPEDGFMIVATDVQSDLPSEFREALILVAVHGDEGSLGFVINRRSACPLLEALEGLGVHTSTVDEPHPTVAAMSLVGSGFVKRRAGKRTEPHAFRGGRTRPDVGWLLFDTEGVPEPEDSCLLTPEIGVTAAPLAMADLVAAGGRSLLLLGHVTWDPGALDQQIEQGSWMRMPADPRLVFETPAERRWSDATCTALGLPKPWLGLARFATA